MMRKWILFFYLATTQLLRVYGQSTTITESFIDEQLQFAANQYQILAHNLPSGKFPKSYDATSGNLTTSNSSWWCSGFYPGTLLYLYEANNNDTIKAKAEKILELLEPEQFNTHTHDLGFMMYCSFGNAYRIWPKQEYKKIIINAAQSLASRFNKTAGVIRSWDHGNWKFPVIIDNMMNLELLTSATRLSGDSSFYHIAMAHANTTMKHHFRSDYSSYHLIDYDTLTGKVLSKQTVQGANDTSSWARGQAWALYGYTVMFRETGNKNFLLQARDVAALLLNHPNKPADNIPYWDYNAPDIPKAPRDASTAAIMASALLELSRFVEQYEKENYIRAAEKMLTSLGSPVYRARLGTNGGFLLKHSVGHFPAKSEIDVPLTYADYYFVEALVRYKKWILSPKKYKDTVHYSKVFGHDKYYRIYLPSEYSSNQNKYPTIYFFHGWGGRHFSDDHAQLNYEAIQTIVDKHKTILVMWDGNIDPEEARPYNTGNHADVKYPVQMSDYFAELIMHIDENYRTLPDRQHRGIIGFSMGGFMAFFLAGKYPDKINAAVNIAGSPEFFIGYPDRHTLYSLRYTFDNLSDVHLRLHNGNADILYYLNEEVRNGAAWSGVPLNYYSFQGGHRIDTLNQITVFSSAVAFVHTHFLQPPLAPTRWTHHDIYSSFKIWDYTVMSNKKDAGFISLYNVNTAGFGLYSHRWLPLGPPLPIDSVTIITSASYRPSALYRIVQFDKQTKQVVHFSKMTDSDGKLTIALKKTDIEMGIYQDSDNPSFVITDFRLKGNHRYISNKGRSYISLELFNRGAELKTNEKLIFRLSTRDSSVKISTNKLTIRPGKNKRFFITQPFVLDVNKQPPVHGEPPQIRLQLHNVQNESKVLADIIIPVVYEAPEMDSIILDDRLGNNNHIAEPGEQIMLLSHQHHLRLYTNDKYVLPEKEILFDEMIPARWPDGYTLSSVITISPYCPKGHLINFYASYETKTFNPIERITTWGKLKLQIQ